MNENQQLSEKTLLTLKCNPPSLPRFPATRYQGSKRKILSELLAVFNTLDYKSPLDLFCGSGVVSLLLRHLGKNVASNDFMLYNQNTAEVFLSFTKEKLISIDIHKDLTFLLYDAKLNGQELISKNYENIFFTETENLEIDRFCQNIIKFDSFKRKLYTYAVGQSLLKKRPYNLFHRKNLCMRTKNVERTFGNAKTWETSILEHSLKCIDELKKFTPSPISIDFKTTSINTSTNLNELSDAHDLIYMDPPYINGKGQPVDYSDFYGFLDGLCDYSLFSKSIDHSYPHKPISKKYSAWQNKETALNEIANICEKWRGATIVMSYRSDGVPTPEEVIKAMEINNRKVEIHSAGEYKYALSNNNNNEELIIISKPSL